MPSCLVRRKVCILPRLNSWVFVQWIFHIRLFAAGLFIPSRFWYYYFVSGIVIQHHTGAAQQALTPCDVATRGSLTFRPPHLLRWHSTVSSQCWVWEERAAALGSCQTVCNDHFGPAGHVCICILNSLIHKQGKLYFFWSIESKVAAVKIKSCHKCSFEVHRAILSAYDVCDEKIDF